MKCLNLFYLLLNLALFNGFVDCQYKINANITNFLQNRIEKYGQQLVNATMTNWTTICEYNGCVCSYQFCFDPLPVSCNKRWNKGCTTCGSLVNINFSGLMVGNRFYNVNVNDDEVREVLCTSQTVDKLMEEIVMGEDMIVRTLAGTYNGVLRNWPTEVVCAIYDTRYRPWFVAASSGVKDVMFIIDASNNISLDGLKTLIKLVSFLLSSLTFNDYASIVVLGNNDNVFSPYFLRADSAGVQYMINYLNALKPSNSSNYQTSFQNAFDIQDRSLDTNRTSNCQGFILFFSSGPPTQGKSDAQQLLNDIDERTTRQNFFFTYSVGDTVDPFLKTLACHTNGIFEQIVGDNYYNSTLSYFLILAKSKTKPSITYSEPYMDALGSGYMTTASIPVFDYSVNPPFLIGVYGFDILMGNLLTIGGIDEIYMAFQSIGSSSCSVVNLSPCQIQSIRNNACGNVDTNCQPLAKSIRKCPDRSLINETSCNIGGVPLTGDNPACCDVNLCSYSQYIAIGVVIGSPFFIFFIFLTLYIWFPNIWNYICCKKCFIGDIDGQVEVNNESINDNNKKSTMKELSILQSGEKDLFKP